MDNRIYTDDNLPYDALRLAIVGLAVSDYRSALKHSSEKKIKELEKFFLSGWGQFLSDNYGQYIIDRVKRE